MGTWLVQLSPLLRPLIQVRWAQLVARRNPDLIDAHQLDEFLFGAARISLDSLRTPLMGLQRSRCFYCDRVLVTTEVDHFLPWSRHPDNLLDNLVASHSTCNNAKSASIAGHRHLAKWVERLHIDEVDEVAADTGSPRRRDRTVGAVAATYLWLPASARLWVEAREYEGADPGRIRALLPSLELAPAEWPFVSRCLRDDAGGVVTLTAAILLR